MNGQIIAPNKIKPGRWYIVAAWLDEKPIERQGWHGTYYDEAPKKPVGEPFLVKAVRLPFLVIEGVGGRVRGIFDTRKCNVMRVRPEFIAALYPNLDTNTNRGDLGGNPAGKKDPNFEKPGFGHVFRQVVR